MLGLEDLVNKFSEKIVKPGIELCRKTCAWPKSLGLLAGLVSYWNIAAMQVPIENTVYTLGIGFSAYYAASIANKYFFSGRRKKSVQQKGGLISRINQLSLDHAHIPATVLGILGPAVLNEATNLASKLNSTFPEYFSLSIPVSYFFAFNFFNCRTHTALFKNFYKHARKARQGFSKILSVSDMVLENPYISGVLAGAVYFSSLNPVLQLKDIAVGGILSSFCAAAAYCLHTFAAGLFHSGSLKFISEDIRLSALSVFKKYNSLENAINAAISNRLLFRDKKRYHRKLVNLYLKQNKIDSALLNMKEGLAEFQQEEAIRNPYDFLRELSGFNVVFWGAIQNPVEQFSGEPNRSLQYAIQSIKEKDYLDMIQHLNRAIGVTGNDLRVQIIKVLAIDALKNDSSGWRRVLHKVIKQYQDQFEQISFTSKKVLKLSFDELLANTFVFAQNPDNPSFRNEHNVSRFVFSCYSDLHSVPKPYYFSAENGTAYSVSSHMSGLPLSDVDITDLDVLHSLEAYFDFCLRTTKSAGRMPDFSASAPVLDPLSAFEDKFLARIPCDSGKKDRIRRSFLPAVGKLSCRPKYFVHGNFHPGNVIKDSERYGLIDFGDACFANICCGVEQFLGHHQVRADKQAIYPALYEFSETGSKDEFLEDCVHSSVFVAAHLLGRSVYYNEGPAVHYRDNLVRSVCFLADTFASGREKDNWRACAEEIQSLEVE